MDSAREDWRLNSRRGPGPQSCEQPGVAQPPSLMEMSFSQVVMQATWPPWPHPWHQVQRAEPFGRGAEKVSKSRLDVEATSVGTEEWEVVSESGFGVVLPEDGCWSWCAATHSAGGSRLMQIEHGSCGVLQR